MEISLSTVYPLTDTPTHRGELNNNPCNIDRGIPPIPWLGLAPASMQHADPRFAVFIAPEYGFRAAAINMRTHAARTRPFTLAAAISIWAPPNENDTKNYLRNVSTWTSYQSTTVVDTTRLDMMVKLLTAICRQEQGRCIYPSEMVEHGLLLAGGWQMLPTDAKV
jgi:hypothetical protein